MCPYGLLVTNKTFRADQKQLEGMSESEDIPLWSGGPARNEDVAVHNIARSSTVSNVYTPCLQVSIGVRTSDKQEGGHMVNEGWMLHLLSIRQSHKGNWRNRPIWQVVQGFWMPAHSTPPPLGPSLMLTLLVRKQMTCDALFVL